ncbi:hypothetical protein LINGRAHAP2_LOCUS17557 [Linum grandiflorum]
MALWKTPKKPDTHLKQNKNKRQSSSQQQPQQIQKPDTKPPSSSASWKGIFSCKDLQTQNQILNQQEEPITPTSKKSKKLKCSGSLCSNTKVMHRPAAELIGTSTNTSTNNASGTSTGSSSRSMKPPVSSDLVISNGGGKRGVVSGSNSTFKGMPFGRFSGCYECRMVVDPVLGGFGGKDSSGLRNSICACPDCGQIFMKAESLELHQAVKHAVSELGAEDTSKNIVEIIFQSSWLKMESPICKIDRILKVHNTQTTIAKFEEYRDSIKSKATNLFPKKHPRCIADGNELLRFHSTTFACSLGLNGSSNLCSTGSCNVCSIIKNGFMTNGGGSEGILTTATSGKAHDKAVGTVAGVEKAEKRAMLVCRVIAGRVMKKNVSVLGAIGNSQSGDDDREEEGGKGEGRNEYDSVAGGDVGVYSNLDELYVFNPMAILPCFVVIYCGF